MADSKFGVITEQGFPLGQFGFNGVKNDEIGGHMQLLVLGNKIALADDAAQGAVLFHDGKSVEVMFKHDAGGFSDFCADGDGDGGRCHYVAGGKHAVSFCFFLK